MKRFQDYKVKSSNLAVKKVIYAQNYNNFTQAITALIGAKEGIRCGANSKDLYRDFITSLLRLGYHFDTVGHSIIASRKKLINNGHQIKQATIRHDVDGDLPAALSCAEIEMRLGVRSTYYLLHTGPYYGTFKNGIFYRNEACGEAYIALQDMGHEVGLHTDALWVYQQWGVDGVQCLLQELEWLRSLGLNISGTAPHNSPSVYGGLSNNEIFKGYDYYEWHVFRDRVRSQLDADVLAGIPVGSIDPEALKLDYEADEIWRLQIPVDWMSVMSSDTIQRYIWDDKSIPALSGSADALYAQVHSRADFKVLNYRSHAECLDSLIVDEAHILYLSVHPEYYGYRDAAVMWP